ncbi:polysaccharide deacetylase family protein [Levilactobacillus enshiensis]|uniref:polysaccharide deacetylase family protein n=1 Tax=Levilactobacillus enshiensis TaxID=2590213 RepID=UPI001179C3F6|nr:polysaccharide deacetylase family protein [Levilactobacillus enshiensis]
MNPRRFRQGLLLTLLFTLVFGLGWTYQRQANKQHRTQESYVLPARYQQLKNGIMVFCYHRVLADTLPTRLAQGLSTNSQLHEFNVPASEFAAQMKFLHDHHVKVISSQQMTRLVRAHQPIRGKYAVLTFDDVDRSVSDNAIPIMQKYSFPFTAFVITGNTGEYREGSQMATWREIRRAKAAAGDRMTLGLHTHNLHHLTAKLQPIFTQPHYTGKFKRDFDCSRKTLQAHTGLAADSFAYPYGGGTPAISHFLAQQNLSWVATLNSGIVTADTDLNETPRLIVNQESWPSIRAWLT